MDQTVNQTMKVWAIRSSGCKDNIERSEENVFQPLEIGLGLEMETTIDYPKEFLNAVGSSP